MRRVFDGSVLAGAWSATPVDVAAAAVGSAGEAAAITAHPATVAASETAAITMFTLPLFLPFGFRIVLSIVVLVIAASERVVPGFTVIVKSTAAAGVPA